MKKQVSFIVRLTSLILTFLLLFTMTIGTGITTVFAKEYKESSYLDVAELAVGDIVGANTVIHRTYSGTGYTVLDAYFNGTKMYSNDDSVYLEHKMILLSISPDPNRSDKAVMEFADYGSGIEADSEDSLRGNLNNADAITLSDDIAINSPIAISGQKTRIINANGHTLSLNADKGGSLFIVTGGSTLILKDDSEAGGVLLGGNNMYDGGGAVHVRSAKLVMQNMTLSGNKGKHGGAIFAKSGTEDLSNCTIKDNYSEGNGGGVFIDEQSTVTMNG